MCVHVCVCFLFFTLSFALQHTRSILQRETGSFGPSQHTKATVNVLRRNWLIPNDRMAGINNTRFNERRMTRHSFCMRNFFSSYCHVPIYTAGWTGAMGVRFLAQGNNSSSWGDLSINKLMHQSQGYCYLLHVCVSICVCASKCMYVCSYIYMCPSILHMFVSMCVCMCMSVSMYVCVSVHVHVFSVHMYVPMQNKIILSCMCNHMHGCMPMRIHLSMHVHVYACMFVSIHIFSCVSYLFASIMCVLSGCLHASIHVCVCVCVCVYVCVCVCVCVRVCESMHD